MKKVKKSIIGKGTKVWDFVNLYECTIGENCKVGSFVEIQNQVTIGNNVKISSHSFICEGVTIEDEVFIGHHVVFTNDKYPSSVDSNGTMKESGDWELRKTVIKKRASIGSNVTILGGIVIGENSIVGAGSVVTKDVLAHTIVAGNPARILRRLKPQP